MTEAELNHLAAQIGDEIFARLGCHAALVNRPKTAPTFSTIHKEIIVPQIDHAPGQHSSHFDSSVAALIDHTILRADATRADVVKVCREAREYSFASVCVNSYWVSLVRSELAGSPVKVCTVVGFPLGAASTPSKADETTTAVRAGAQEIDMVINIGELKSGNHEAVRSDIAAVIGAAHQGNAIVKVIIETALLTDAEKVTACELAKQAGAEFVKTSTGFSTAGATVHDIALMRATVGPNIGVKASGGIRTLDDLRAMVAAGATRIGASASVKMIEATAL